MAVEPRVRKSAEERREEILSVAIRHFALGGLHGTSTESIAREAGISQPYLFRLFRTKKELFLACVDRADGRVFEAFRKAAAEAGDEDRLKAMGHTYIDELLPDRHAILMQMQAYVATSDPDIQAHVRGNFERLVAEVTELSGADEASVWNFFAQGMLLNVTQSLDLASIAGTSEWAASWCNGPPEPPEG
ncbi:MAG TPA: TetR/AcrR family transcriptional regulator [Solirubrobacteraceae bacterium]|nr:TetR/AcrR family transcriptional regulator [Solirubrobacteraceae bacterium]